MPDINELIAEINKYKQTATCGTALTISGSLWEKLKAENPTLSRKELGVSEIFIDDKCDGFSVENWELC